MKSLSGFLVFFFQIHVSVTKFFFDFVSLKSNDFALVLRNFNAIEVKIFESYSNSYYKIPYGSYTRNLYIKSHGNFLALLSYHKKRSEIFLRL